MLEMKLEVFTSFIAFLTFFFLFSSVVCEKKNSRLKLSFLIFILLYNVILFCELLLRLPFMFNWHVPIIHVSFAAFMCTGIAYLDFTYTIYAKEKKWLYKLFFILAIVSVIVTLLPGSFMVKCAGKQVVAMPGTVPSVIMLFSLVGATLHAVTVLFQYRSSEFTKEQKSISVMLLWGTLLSIITGLVVLVIVPLFFPKLIVVYQYTSLSPLWIGILLYIAMRKYHFITIEFSDIKLVAQTLFETVKEGVVLFDSSGKVVMTNREATNLLGDLEDYEDVESLIPAYAYNRSMVGIRTEIEAPEKVIPAIVSQSDIQGNRYSLGKMLIIHDIFEQVQLEQEREEMKERIRQSEKLESIGQLAGGIAHDFNNQLTGIIGCTESLRIEYKNNAEAQKMLDMILKSAQSSADLTKKLLAFARKGKYLTTEFDIHDVIHEVESILKRTIDKRIELEVELTAERSTVMGDKTQIQNALLNLAINSCDAMEENGGVLSFYTEVVDKDEVATIVGISLKKQVDYLSVSVSDTGTGMTEETRKRIFEPFFTTKELGKGTGMGLSAVYGTVVNHNGTIAVNSILGEGTSFNILFPLVAKEKIVIDEHAQVVDLKGTGRVLLVDDEPLILKIGKNMLERAGYTVFTVDNGLDALDLFREKNVNFDLIVLDMIMPELRGEEVYKQIRIVDAEIPVLLSSGYSEDGIARELLKSKHTDFIQKPYQRQSFLRAVKMCLQK